MIYKYRSLDKLDKIADILVNERLYCSSYDRLNDPFEGQFLVRRDVQVFLERSGEVFGSYKTITPPTAAELKSIHKDGLNRLICSLCWDRLEMKMWGHYGGSHSGVAIGINVDGLLEKKIHKVNYYPDLRHLDAENICDDNEHLKKILTSKTIHWQHEKEYRLLYSKKYFCIKGRIKEIIFGNRCSHAQMTIIAKLAPAGCKYFKTSLNHHSPSLDLNSVSKKSLLQQAFHSF